MQQLYGVAVGVAERGDPSIPRLTFGRSGEFDACGNEPAVNVLNELTELLPDGTWLERLVFKQDKVDLFGLSSKASTLISEIETSPIFEDVAFQAPVVQEERFSSERFQISTRVSLPNDYAN